MGEEHTMQDVSIHVAIDAELVSAGEASASYVRVRVRVPRVVRSEQVRPALNLGIVLDRSGSMGGDKIVKAQEAAIAAVRSLEARDRFNLVVYSDEADLLVPLSTGTEEAKRVAEDALRGVQSNGCTNLHGGWSKSAENLLEIAEAGSMSRCLLMTDGLVNRGVTLHTEIAARVEEMRERGVVTSAFGVGEDFDERLLDRIASAGAGNFHYVESAEDIPGFIASEVGETLETVVADASVLVRTPPGCAVRSLNEHPVVKSGRSHFVRVGSLFSGQVLTCLLELKWRGGQVGECLPVRIGLAAGDGRRMVVPTGVEFAYADEERCNAQTRDIGVDIEVARLIAAAASRDALAYNKDGDFQMAGEALSSAAAAIRIGARGRPELLEIAANLDARRRQYEQQMSSSARKALFNRDIMEMKRGIRGDDYDTDRRRRRSAFVREVQLVGTDGNMVSALTSAANVLGPHLRRLGPGIDLRTGMLVLPAGDAAMPLDRAGERSLASILRARFGSASVVYLSQGRRLADNWFSHWLESERTVVSSLYGWERTAAVPVEAFVAYEVLLYAPYAIAPRYDVLTMAHEETRACVYDFCGERADIEIKLQTMDVCPECERKLTKLGIETSVFRDLCQAVRSLAMPENTIGV